MPCVRIRSSCSSIHTSWYEPHITPVNMRCRRTPAPAAAGEPGCVAVEPPGDLAERMADRLGLVVERAEALDAAVVVGGIGMVVGLAVAQLPVGTQRFEDLVHLQESVVLLRQASRKPGRLTSSSSAKRYASRPRASAATTRGLAVRRLAFLLHRLQVLDCFFSVNPASSATFSTLPKALIRKRVVHPETRRRVMCHAAHNTHLQSGT